MLLLIQGIFFQEAQGLRIGYSPREGERLFIVRGIGRGLFSGVLRQDELNSSWMGEMSDLLGESRISRGHYDKAGGTFTFQKEYCERRDGMIAYRFEISPDGTFVGTWTMTFGSGPARCVVTEVDESFVQVPKEFQLSLI